MSLLLVRLSLVPVHDATTGEVIRRKFHDDSVVGEDTDVVHPHLSADVRQHFVTVFQFHSEHGVGQRFNDRALELDRAVLFGHSGVVSFRYRCVP